MKKNLLFVFVLLRLVSFSQHQHDPMHAEKDTIPKRKDMEGMQMQHDTVPGAMKGMDMQGMQHHMSMSHVYSLNLPMGRNGSGTSWLPDASPMYAYMYHSHGWMFMIHENLFIRYNDQDFTNKGSRGNNEFDMPAWVMGMGQKQVGKNGLFHFSAMFSFDAFTARSGGFPLLFQTGETYKGEPIVDRQHPHDLFAELAVSYSQALSEKADIFFYFGYPGEPALGPVAYMHRPSALADPDVPISHHWVDATHITFGVATVGFRYSNWKIEGSSFTGREPDENRYDFDKPRFDSWSGRLSFNPTENWALQVSHGFIKSPEQLHPDEDINRTTASAIYSLPVSSGTFNATALWGMNKIKDQEAANAFLLEGSLKRNKFEFYSRYEWVQKSTEELNLDETIYGATSVFPINSLTAGASYDLFKLGELNVAGGGQLTVYHADDRLDKLYGKNPMAFEVYLRLCHQ